MVVEVSQKSWVEDTTVEFSEDILIRFNSTNVDEPVVEGRNACLLVWCTGGGYASPEEDRAVRGWVGRGLVRSQLVIEEGVRFIVESAVRSPDQDSTGLLVLWVYVRQDPFQGGVIQVGVWFEALTQVCDLAVYHVDIYRTETTEAFSDFGRSTIGDRTTIVEGDRELVGVLFGAVPDYLSMEKGV